MKKIPRIATINTVNELKKAHKDFWLICREECDECRYDDGVCIKESTVCFYRYLAEEIEVEE